MGRGSPSWVETELGLNFCWDVRKLWLADLPIVAMPVSEFEWLLDRPFWKDGGRKDVLCPRDVARFRGRYPAEYDRTMTADLSYPINVILLRRRWIILDGLHRLLKAWICGHEMIRAKQAHEDDIPLFRRLPWEPSNHPAPPRTVS